MKTLVAVAHGSRDPRSARTVAAVVETVRSRRPDVDVRVAYLDLTEPSVDDVLDDLAAEGARSAVLVPLLLGSAFHARVDLPAILDAARTRHTNMTLTQADVLGDDRRLVDTLRLRIIETGVALDDPTVGIAVAAVGSSHAPANQRTRALAQRVLLGTSWTAAVTCFATSQDPSPAQALSSLEAAGARAIVAAPWFLAPGLLTDRVFAAAAEYDGTVLQAQVLGDHPLVAEVVSQRYDAAVQSVSVRMSA